MQASEAPSGLSTQLPQSWGLSGSREETPLGQETREAEGPVGGGRKLQHRAGLVGGGAASSRGHLHPQQPA